jgi:hypothetical protein
LLTPFSVPFIVPELLFDRALCDAVFALGVRSLLRPPFGTVKTLPSFPPRPSRTVLPNVPFAPGVCGHPPGSCVAAANACDSEDNRCRSLDRRPLLLTSPFCVDCVYDAGVWPASATPVPPEGRLSTAWIMSQAECCAAWMSEDFLTLSELAWDGSRCRGSSSWSAWGSADARMVVLGVGGEGGVVCWYVIATDRQRHSQVGSEVGAVGAVSSWRSAIWARRRHSRQYDREQSAVDASSQGMPC